jgi:hypothetical protein
MSTETAVIPSFAAPMLPSWVAPEARELLSKYTADAVELANDIKSVSVVDSGTAARITDLLSIAAKTQRDVEEARRLVTDPLKRKAKEVEDAVRPIVAALDELIRVGKSKVITWSRAENERAKREYEEREKAEAAAIATAQTAAVQTGGPVAVADVPPPPAPAPRGIRTDYGSATMRKVWDFEIVDASKIPVSFLVPNEQAIRGAVKGGTRDIPGVRIFQRDDVAVRPR